MRQPKFALIGAAGYIAPRHMRAMRECHGDLLAALDPCDSVGIIDSYYPEADFFTEFERFDRHIEKLKRKGKKPEYISICSPNYLHDAHIRFALRSQAHAICEKPLVLNPWNIDALQEVESESGYKIYPILQLRSHPALQDLAHKTWFEIDQNPKKKWDIDLSYITPRGKWYNYSWKGDISRSGGIATNIGIHFFDLLCWIFGKIEKSVVHVSNETYCAGFLELKHARIRWFLSISKLDLPPRQKSLEDQPYRSICINGEELDFSHGFTNLHSRCYHEILNEQGHSLEETKTSIEIVHALRNTKPAGLKGDYHPFCIRS